jgi:hypothetical protein
LVNRKLSMISSSTARRAVLGSIIAILVLTVLEFPPPIGFETRPQSDVSPLWLIFFIVILIVEIATVPLIYKRPIVGRRFGIVAAALNILQVGSDQAHLLQPEVAPLEYSVLEFAVVLASFVLAFFSWKVPHRLEMRPNSLIPGNAAT